MTKSAFAGNLDAVQAQLIPISGVFCAVSESVPRVFGSTAGYEHPQVDFSVGANKFAEKRIPRGASFEMTDRDCTSNSEIRYRTPPRAAGYRKRGRTFNRDAGEGGLQVINPQMAGYPDPDAQGP